MPGARSAEACDLDNDGDLDVVGAVVDTDEVNWFKNTGGDPIVWEKHIITDSFDKSHDTAVSDIDGDGDLDVVGAGWSNTNSGIILWTNNGDDPITWTEHDVASDFIQALTVRTADVDGDGDLDILGTATVNLNQVAWWRNDGGDPLTWTKHIIAESFVGAHGVEAWDVDADGDLDVIGTGCVNNKLCWWEVSEYVSEGELISSILDTGMSTESAGLEWNAFLPSGTDIHFNFRSSDNPESMGTWSDSITVQGETGMSLDRYVQYRAVFQTSDPDVSCILEDLTAVFDSTPQNMEISLNMPASSYGEGDIFDLDLDVINYWYTRDADLYILMEVYGQYWCYPSWISLTEGIDYADFSISAGQNSALTVIPGFAMPAVSPAGPFYFYAAMFEDGTLSADTLISNVAVSEFSLE